MDEKIISVKNDLSQLSVIVEGLEEISESWSLPSEALFNLNLVIEEIFTNIVFYGFSDENVHMVVFRILREDKFLKLVIEDDGKEFDPTEAPDPDHIDKPLEDREVGGLGIHFVRVIMETVKYNRINNKNILTLTYKTG